MPWETAAKVTSPVALVAFIIAILAWMYRSSLISREKLIASAPESERADLVEDALKFFHIATEGLTRAQKYRLALEQIHSDERRFRWTATIVGLVAVLLALVSGYAIARTTGAEPNPAPQVQTDSVRTERPPPQDTIAPETEGGDTSAPRTGEGVSPSQRPTATRPRRPPPSEPWPQTVADQVDSHVVLASDFIRRNEFRWAQDQLNKAEQYLANLPPVERRVRLAARIVAVRRWMFECQRAYLNAAEPSTFTCDIPQP